MDYITNIGIRMNTFLIVGLILGFVSFTAQFHAIHAQGDEFANAILFAFFTGFLSVISLIISIFV